MHRLASAPTVLLAALAVSCTGAGRVAAAPVIGPGHEAEIVALLDPYGMGREIVDGWRCTGITASQAIEITLGRGGGTITVVLHDPAWPGAAQHGSPHFRIAVRASPEVDAAERDRVGAVVAQLVADNDHTDLWNESAAAPFPRQQPRRRLAPGPLRAAGLLLTLLAAVAAHAWRRAGGAAARTREPLPALVAREWAALLGLTLLAALALLVPSYLRYARYGIRSFDIGIYTHAFWNALHGHGLFNSPEGMDHLASHASPGLYLLLPAYALAPHPYTLLALNGLALASAAIPAYLIARRRLDALASLLCTAVLLMNPALGSLNYDVHEITFAVPLLLWVLLFLQCRRGAALLAVLVPAMLLKEDVAVWACLLGVYLILFQRRWHLGTAVLLLGALWVVVGIGLIVPYYGGNHAHTFMSRYGALGDDWWAIALSPLRRPAAFFAIVGSRATAQYLVMVLAPFAFLPLLSPRELVLAIPPLAENLLSAQWEMRSGQYHYEAILLPALYLAFAGAVARLSALGRVRARGRVAVGLLTALVLALPLLDRMLGRGFLVDVGGDPARRELDAIVARVPAGVPVISPQHVQPHLSDRPVSAYLADHDSLPSDQPPFEYAIVPASAAPLPAGYEITWQGAAYSLFQHR